MNIDFFVAAFLAATLMPPFTASGIKLDPNVGSNWYASSSSVPIASPSSEKIPTTLYKNYNSAYNVPTSFVPTSNVNVLRTEAGGENSDTINYYNLQQNPTLQTITSDSPSGKQYQYLEYNPTGNSYNVFPVENAGAEGAEQRQEILGPLPIGSGNGDGGSLFDNFPNFGGFDGITGTASNIAQAIGLGGLGILGSLIVLAVGGPLIVFAIVFPVAILIIAILVFPVLQLTLPPGDPNLGRRFKSGAMSTVRKAKEALQSEECVERLSCVLAEKSRKLPYESFILEKMNTVKNTWVNRVAKSVKSGRAGEDCKQFKCTPVTKFKNVYENLTSTSITENVQNEKQ